MRSILTALLLLAAQTTPPANLPPAYPREGAVKILGNERVTVWEFATPPAAARHRHSHDAVAVAIDGRNPPATWVARGTVHAGEDAGRASRVYVFELK